MRHVLIRSYATALVVTRSLRPLLEGTARTMAYMALPLDGFGSHCRRFLLSLPATIGTLHGCIKSRTRAGKLSKTNRTEPIAVGRQSSDDDPAIEPSLHESTSRTLVDLTRDMPTPEAWLTCHGVGNPCMKTAAAVLDALPPLPRCHPILTLWIRSAHAGRCG